ncbi:MAG TPA: hypothetical protein VJX67_07745, partial [Blastocatellia bacterium]|nr:hypothetical protein [Blastocatellia bacterium]
MIISRLSANRLYVLWLAAATMMACLLTVNARQEPASPAGALQGRFKLLSDEGTLRSELMKLPGTLIAEGKNNQPIGELRLRRYRVEELVPETAVEAEISGRRVQLHKAWRLTILGGPFRVGNAPLIAWIDGKPIGI